MTKYSYAYYNRLAGYYGLPFYLDIEANEMASFMKAVLFNGDEKTLKTLVEDDLYYLGTFDTDTCMFNTKCEFLIHIGELAADILAKKFGGSVNGSEEK